MQQNRVHLIAFALITASTFYVILDLEYRRLGLIRIDSVDKVRLILETVWVDFVALAGVCQLAKYIILQVGIQQIWSTDKA